MQKTIKATVTQFILLMVFSSCVTFSSCNNEELFIESITEVFEVDTTNNEDNSTTVDTATPCDFTLETVQSGDTVIINCMMDLGGQTINLPDNVTIIYDGGDIINGTINFSNNSVISGELLNTSLTISGSTPQMKDTTFNFDPHRWGIVEGEVSDVIATSNRDIIRQTINLVKELGVNTFIIDNIDAYFNVSTAKGGGHDQEATIFIPSNFHFKMGDNCNLRVQPNGSVRSVLLYSRSTENIMISGGKLWGDRYTHDYNTISSSHEWGHMIMFRGVHNGVVDNVEMHEGTGDGFEVGGISHRNNDGSLKPDGRESFNVTVKNCLINDNRRNNISIVDGTNIFIEYNTIRNSGSGDDSSGVSSNGTSPRAGIDIEPYKTNAPDNNSVYKLERCEEIHIRNNTFENNYSIDVVIFSGEKNYIYGNTFKSERAVGTAYGYNSKIYDNNFVRPEGLMSGSQAVILGNKYWANGTHRIKDFEVYNNNFSGYQFAIVAGGLGHEFKNNAISDCQRGIILKSSEDLIFDNNIISSNISNSYGYYTFSNESTIKNALIKNGESNVQGRDLLIFYKNNLEIGSITIDNVDFNGGGVFLKAVQNITLKNCVFEDIKIEDCDPILINNN